MIQDQAKEIAFFAEGFLNKMGGSKKESKEKKKCPECEGVGFDEDTERSCPACDGSGVK